MSFLPADLYAQIEQSMPIACVDFVPVRRDKNGIPAEVGLILRESPFGQVWCHLGGRIQYGETLANAIQRHSRESLGAVPHVGVDPQPMWVYQWFPERVAPSDGLTFGADPRKHAIGLSFIVDLGEQLITPANEALDFAYFDVAELPEPLWPGCAELLTRLIPGAASHHTIS